MSLRLILASASPARLALLRAAGIEPQVMVSDVDEDAVQAGLGSPGAAALVAALATAKAEAVATRLVPVDGAGRRGGAHETLLVLGCDSMFEMGGLLRGKPSGPGEAGERIRSMRENTGVLHTGHHLLEVGAGRAAGAVQSTTIRFGPMTDAEVDAYVASGEPLGVAGAFTLDGRSAPFIDGVEGDHTNVIGLSLPSLRRMLAELGHSVTDLW